MVEACLKRLAFDRRDPPNPGSFVLAHEPENSRCSTETVSDRRCLDPVVAVAMPARWRNQGCQTLDQFERGQHQADAAARSGAPCCATVNVWSVPLDRQLPAARPSRTHSIAIRRSSFNFHHFCWLRK